MTAFTAVPAAGADQPAASTAKIKTASHTKFLTLPIDVHSALGPGLLEPLYQRCMSIEMASRGLRFREQLALPVTYKGHDVGFGYRIDFLVEDEVVLELKSVERILPVHHAQVLTYLRLLKVRQAFLMNFNQRRLVDGLRSFLLTPPCLPPK